MQSNQWRNKRNQLNMSSIPAFGMQYSIANYSTESKSDLTKSFAEEMLIHNLHMMPNPLQKNLADTIPTAEPKTPPQLFPKPNIQTETVQTEARSDNMFMGISSFISGVFSAISGGMFQRRRSPAPQYYDCCDREPDWQPANRADLNKSTADQSGAVDAMSADCRAAVAHCEDKLNRVRNLLTSKPVPTTAKHKRRPRRAFIEPGSVEESFEDAFSPEDFVQLSNDDHIECFSAYNHHNGEMIEAVAPKVKTEMAPVKEVMDIVNTVPAAEIVTKEPEPNDAVGKPIVNCIETVNSESKHNVPASKTVEELKDEKGEVIAACEEKVNKLKALLSRKPRTSRLDPKPEADSISEPVTGKKDYRKCLQIDKTSDKHFKNPNRSTDKRKKSQMIKNIQEDMCFPNTLEVEDVSSPDSSPSLKPTQPCDLTLPTVNELVPEPEPEYFDEVHGRFRSTSTTDSEDSFQIVFTDSSKAGRNRNISDCDSEDSFIVFEDSPDSCYTSHDVFGDTESDSDSDVSDSGCGVSCKLSHSLTRTVGDLTDDSLFDETVRGDSDEVDSATVCEDLPDFTEKNTGLLLNDAKKLLKKQQPPKKVSFSAKPPKVHVMRVWAFAARQARRGNWEQDAMDRDRFKRKIADVDMAVSWVLKPQHRSRVMFQRFMPWWNAQRRLEIAEKKRKIEEEKLKEEERKREEEKLKEEERKREEERLREESVRESSEVSGNDENCVESVSNVIPNGTDADGKNIGNGPNGELKKVQGTADKNSIDSVINVDIPNGNDADDKNIGNGPNGELKKVKGTADIEKGAVNNVSKSDRKILAKCDFYNKSGKINSNDTNSIEIASSVALDT